MCWLGWHGAKKVGSYNFTTVLNNFKGLPLKLLEFFHFKYIANSEGSYFFVGLSVLTIKYSVKEGKIARFSLKHREKVKKKHTWFPGQIMYRIIENHWHYETSSYVVHYGERFGFK